MKISYIMIVLNGMPFIHAALESIYDSAHEIIIIEGAVKLCMFAANSDGSSNDGTVEFIKTFPDPKNKIRLIQGTWPEKCEMQNKAVEIATGDYIWLVDADEVYKKSDIDIIIEMLEKDPSITQINFPFIHFWRGFDYILSSEILKKTKGAFRIFKLSRPCFFTSHRPPTFLLKQYKKTAYDVHLVNCHVLREKGIFIYHYSYVLESQARQKITLYKNYGWGKIWNIDLDDWFSNCFLKWTPENKEAIEKKYPIWTGDLNSRTVHFSGLHPEAMVSVMLKLRGEK